MNPNDEQDYDKKFDAGLWKKLGSYIKTYKLNVFLTIFFMFICALGDAVWPLFTQYAIDNFITGKDTSTLFAFIIIIAFYIVFYCFNTFCFVYNSGRIETGLVYDIRKAGFKKLQELSFSFYDTTAVGWIMARMTSDASQIGNIIAWGFQDGVYGVIMIIVIIIFMFALNPFLAIVVLTVTPALAITCMYFQKRILAGYRKTRKVNSKITASYNECITGARTTKTLIREEANFNEFENLTKEMRVASVRTAVLSSLFAPIVTTLGSVSVALVLWTGGIITVQGIITIGELSAFLSYATQIFNPIQNVANIFSNIQQAQASAERTISLLDTEVDITDSNELVEIYGDYPNPHKENWPNISGDIEFQNVNFAYKTGEKILKNFNLKIKAGEKIALVGETGSGKSTIVNLICRFYEPTDGKILIDGVDYKERTQIWLQSNLGYVLQSPHLFSGNIMENIRYGNLDATDDEVIEAAKAVNAYDFIMKFQDGFNTDVGEGGSKLSAGEKQLISFARAIIGDPKIFVLDEATSSIDTETEVVIQNAVDRILRGRTSFIVAHRLSTIRSCNRILVIKSGEILESGSHEELLKLGGYYYNLYTNQFKQEAEDKALS